MRVKYLVMSVTFQKSNSLGRGTSSKHIVHLRPSNPSDDIRDDVVLAYEDDPQLEVGKHYSIDLTPAGV